MENSELILNFIEKRNTSCYKIAQSTGISESTFSKWKVKPTSKVDLSIVQKIATYFNTTIDSILDSNQSKKNMPSLSDDELELFQSFNKLSDKDKGKVMERAETLAELAAERAAKERAAEHLQKKVQIDEPAADEQLSKPMTHRIAYYDYPASAGTGLFLDETTAEKRNIVQTSEALRADFAIPIKGNSMEPDFSDGDVVLVESCPCVSRGEIGIFVLNGDAFIKEFGGDRLISHNETYDPILLKEYESAVCMGRVLGKAKIIE